MMSKKNCGRSNEIYIARVPQFSLPCVAQSTRPSVGLGVRRFLPPTGVGESLAREAHHLTIFPCLAIRFKVQLNHLDQSERRREKIYGFVLNARLLGTLYITHTLRHRRTLASVLPGCSRAPESEHGNNIDPLYGTACGAKVIYPHLTPLTPSSYTASST